MDTISEIRARIVGLDELARYLDLHGLTGLLSGTANTVWFYCPDLDRYDQLSTLVGDPDDPQVEWRSDTKYQFVTRSFGGGVRLEVFTDKEPVAVHPFDEVAA